jgi:DNA-binding CsgD family transcriptional regulator
MPQNALVKLIYEAVNDPLLWDAFLTGLAEAVHSETAGLLAQDKTGQWANTLAVVGMDAQSRRAYDEYFVSRNPWLLRRKMFAGSVETGEQVLSNQELMKTDFYREFLKPHTWLHACSVVTNVEESTFSSVYILRSGRNGAFTSGDIRLCSYLVPHLQTAARIRQRIVDLEATLDRLIVGEIDSKILAKMGLTPAETRLAGALFTGQSVESYAREAAISINTARWHVKQIYAKIGVKRQSELIHTLLKRHCSR